MIEKLINSLKARGIEHTPDIALSPLSSFRVGGKGELGIFPKDTDELIFCLSETHAADLTYHVIGKGSNILFLDGRLSGVFIFTKNLNNVEIIGNTVRAESGATLSGTATTAAKASLCGLEFAKGIPGSIGGAIFMNAGAYGGQMSDVVVSSICYDIDNGHVISITDHGFSYRKSIYEKNPSLICLSVEMMLKEGRTEQIIEKCDEYAQKRRQSQPLEYPSAGSYFKRPEGHFTGKLIEDCGLKGLTLGGAAVSEKHAGFIINRGGATASDILELEKKIKDAVYEKFGVKLEREVRVIG